MAAQLDEKIRKITEQKNERDAILASMVEGVIAVDTAERLIGLNRAASEILALDASAVAGRYLQEACRVADLQQFVAAILRTQSTQEGQFSLPGPKARIVQALGSPLLGERGQNMGAVVVLHDITRLHELEIVRRDFVANVSHELRTPITSIKGFVETLLDGSMDNAEQTGRFLSIIARQTDRLDAIITDLLTLSDLEQSSRGAIGRQPTDLRTLLQAAIELVEQKAKAAQVTIPLRCDSELVVTVNPPLLEQAVVNLLDNAIKYSNRGGVVEVTAQTLDRGFSVSVKDHGCGIEKQHFPRLFERFYRVDRARSRELGGTGLGLSIVKHIVSVHGGQVYVESTPGKGSIFTIVVPLS